MNHPDKQLSANSLGVRRRIKFSKLDTCGFGPGFFTRDAGESQAAFARRLRDHGEPGKVSAYVRAMRKGAVFPPVIVVRHEGTLNLSDGQHRCCAAAIVGKDYIDAVVFDVATYDEFDLVGAHAFLLMESDVPWEKCSQVISAALAASRQATVTVATYA